MPDQTVLHGPIALDPKLVQETPIKQPPGASTGPSIPPQADLSKAQDRIIEHEGQMGVFTPLTNAQGVPSDEEARRSVAKVVQSLEQEVARLKAANAELSRASVRPPASSQHFASALQHAADQLQVQLSSTLNPVSDFAVKELSLEANVMIGINTAGEIEYGFVPLGAKVAPEQLSRLSLTIVPLPKKPVSAAWADSALDLHRPLADVKGLSSADLKNLYSNRLYTVGDLLQTRSRMRSTVELAALLKVDRDQLATWLTNAELLTVPGIDPERATALAACGITDLSTLAQQAPENLLSQVNEKLRQAGSSAKPVDVAECGKWVTVANSSMSAKK